MRDITLVAVVLVTACGAAPDMTSEEAPALTPEEALSLIHGAASIPKSLLVEVTDAGASVSPKTLSTIPLSMLLLSVEIPETETEDLRRLWEEGDAPDVGDLWVSAGPGRLTLLPQQSISDIEIKSKRALAEGSFRYRREGAMEAKIEFHAERTADGWRVVQFRLPAAAATTALAENGAWKPSWE